jgi:vitamin-K-epoxide reductase (warfarin-sensitive)
MAALTGCNEARRHPQIEWPEAELMRYTLLVLAVAGVLVSALALIRHFSAEEEIEARGSFWNSSAVIHSQYADVEGIPVAVVGIAGYGLLGALAFFRRRELTAVFSLLGLGYALYLTNIEAHVLELWCVTCVVSLALITLLAFIAFGELLSQRDAPKHG